MGFISWIVIGLVAGWLTGKIMGGPAKGALMDIIIGLLGAVVGGFLMSLLHLSPEGGYIYTIIVAVLGAVVLTWVFRKVTAKSS
ncbi:MAG TPA: GlsB/YeaQ/YmgE family stress response membrane protein [Anaeromyxobacteraceae bacterium]|nr:GlsB/YeaQ/YmgE family stress response membrane protein [Anaeromyxobacteraceae bacterium]